MPPRPRVEPTDDWRQIEPLARAAGQYTDEPIRPVVRFGQSPAERAAETGAAVRTLGTAGFVPPPKIDMHRTLPPVVRRVIIDAEREHLPPTIHEPTASSWGRCGHRLRPHSVTPVT